MEILVADDGSEDPMQDRARALLRRYGDKEAVFLSAPENQGTVRNFQRALEAAKGKYVYAISPGISFIRIRCWPG